MQKIIELINKEFKERKSLGGNWEAYEVEEYLEEIRTSLINKAQAINYIPCCKSDSEQLSVAWKALEWAGYTKGEEFTDDDIQEIFTNISQKGSRLKIQVSSLKH